MPAPPWTLHTGVQSVVDRWREHRSVQPFMAAERELPTEEGHFVDFPNDFNGELIAAVQKRGIEHLYQHQRDAVDAARRGEHVVLATPTASGKSLCFHLPVLEAMANDPSATALFLYPTKALARDQEHGLRSLLHDAGLNIGATVYDGDTPPDARRAARESGRIIMSNPDMLHASILPQHARWARTLQNLRYVVVDELHTYRGVFGSHVAHVLARLRRVAQFHGSDPQFICATATIGNPGEHAARLIGAQRNEVAVISHSSAPRGLRQLFVYNPPVVNAELGIRASYIKRAVSLARDLIQARVRTIIFGASRNSVEIMLKYLRDAFADSPSMRDAIVAYRGGYLPDTRRRIEKGLRDGQVLCVVATSALELGIDIGSLDAVICASYPGSLAETWQRFGRAGRRGEQSIAVLVTSSTPLNQFLAHHPDYLLDGEIEQARIDPHNAEILIQHLKCAAFELPFRNDEAFGTLPKDDTLAALSYLEEHGVVHESGDRFFWSDDAFPANHVSLRRIGWDNFVIIDVETENALAEVDWHSAPSMIHEQAIYQHDGQQYQVERLDYENHKAYVRLVKPDYFTTAMRDVKVSVIAHEAERPQLKALNGWGEVSIVEKVVGYKKIKFHTHENSGYGEVRLPDIQMHTTSYWLTVPAAVCQELGRAKAVEGLRGLASALELVATLALMCDPRDIGRSMGDAAPDAPQPHEQFSVTAYLYDNVPGGVGLAERLYERAEPLLRRAAGLIHACPCDWGCPSCVGATVLADSPSPDAAATASNGRKAAALALVNTLGITPQCEILTKPLLGVAE